MPESPLLLLTSSCTATCMKQLGMVGNVLTDKGGDEVVRVVITCLHSEGHGDLCLLCSCDESQGLQLVYLAGQKVVLCALVAENVQISPFVRLDQLGCIVLLPCLFVIAQVQAQSLCPPRHIHRVADRCKRRHGGVAIRVLQSNCQGTVAAHGVARDGAEGRHREIGLNKLGQLLHHVVVHVVMLLVLLCRGVEIEARPHAEVVDLRLLVRHALATRRRVWHH
mmetsp:Transcript_50528/g.132887  ORF Transcript_50528/g.132887 Transcript_50528/m.132887 type:complete len:223 (+) Transcript_50528:38-706(+)